MRIALGGRRTARARFLYDRVTNRWALVGALRGAAETQACELMDHDIEGVPYVRPRGRWVRDAGFVMGRYVKIEVSEEGYRRKRSCGNDFLMCSYKDTRASATKPRAERPEFEGRR